MADRDPRELAAELRRRADGPFGSPTSQGLREAADALDALQEAVDDMDAFHRAQYAAGAQITEDKLRAENERLVNALRRAEADMLDLWSQGFDSERSLVAIRALGRLRDALSRTGGEAWS